ncbi:MAG: FAD:protein FMN transferase [Aggregatilineales bacterium]
MTEKMIHMIEFRAMGCQVNVQLEADKSGAVILSYVPEQVEAIEAQLTRFRPDSDLMRFNARAGEFVQVGEVLYENMRAAKHTALLTNGLYNPLILPAMLANGYDRSFETIDHVEATPTIPVLDWHDIELRPSTHEIKIPAGSAVDLGGIAKGWATGNLADALAQYGACLVNIGGDMTGRGTPGDLPGWLIEIEDPFTHDVFETVFLHNMSITTSGTDFRRWNDKQGNRYHHIINPYTGNCADTDVVSVTVLHPNAPIAEAYCKAVLLKGAEAGLNWLNHQWHTAGLVFKKDGAVLATSTLTPLSMKGLLSYETFRTLNHTFDAVRRRISRDGTDKSRSHHAE